MNVRPARLLLWVVLFGSCSGPEMFLPGSLGGLTLSSTVTGSEARALVDRMHGKHVTPEQNAAGVYTGPGGGATLYLSAYSTVEAARESGIMMKEKMLQGNNAFSPVSDRTVEGRIVSVCTGLEQVHVFFASGRILYWLAVDPAIAEETASALLRAAGNAP